MCYKTAFANDLLNIVPKLTKFWFRPYLLWSDPMNLNIGSVEDERSRSDQPAMLISDSSIDDLH